MDILNSDWLIHMLNKAGNTPQSRMLSLFDILEDWSEAPGVTPQIDLNLASHNHLQTYLSLEAAKAGAAMPEMLAMQLYVMALSAFNEKVQGTKTASQNSNPPLMQAKCAAKALISAQTKNEFSLSKSTVYGIAASIAGVIAVSLFFVMNNPIHNNPIKSAMVDSKLQPTLVSAKNIANPEETATLIAQIEQMRKGSCQFPEALQLPDSYKKVYFENIILGQISTDPNDQKLVKELLLKVRCNYTPMLMANSKN